MRHSSCRTVTYLLPRRMERATGRGRLSTHIRYQGLIVYHTSLVYFFLLSPISSMTYSLKILLNLVSMNSG